MRVTLIENELEKNKKQLHDLNVCWINTDQFRGLLYASTL